MLKKFALTGLGVALLVSPSLTFAQVAVSPLAQSTTTVDVVQSQIAALLAELQQLQAQIVRLQGQGSVQSNCVDLSNNLTLGSSGSDVTSLQTYLIGSGLLDAQYNTGYYGFLTAQSVGKLQMNLGILSSANDSAFGITGPQTRAAISCTQPAPNAALSATPTSGPAPLQVLFTAGLNNFNIHFGDGTSATASNNVDATYDNWSCDAAGPSSTCGIKHLYNIPGIYTATLYSTNGTQVGTATVTVGGTTPAAGPFTISVSPTPTSQTVLPGSVGVTVANILLDASGSSEDIRLAQIISVYTDNITPDPSSCQAYDGTTPLNTGSRTVNLNTSGTGPQAVSFVFDNALTVARGTVKTLSIKCNIPSTVTSGSFSWGLMSGTAACGTGMSTMHSICPTVVTSPGPTMTIAAGGPGSLSVSADASSSLYQIVAGGSTGVTIGVLDLQTSGEDMIVHKVGLTLTSGSPGDVSQVYLYSTGGVLVGTAVFSGNSTTATSTLTTPLAANSVKQPIIVIKADIGSVGIGQPATAGDLVQVNVANYEATGNTTGIIVRGGASTNFAGVRIFKSYPTVALGPLPTSGLADGRLLRFSVTANSSGPVGLGQMMFRINGMSSAGTATLYGYTDSSYSQPIAANMAGSVGSAAIQGSNVSIVINPAQPIEVPAGATYYFQVVDSAVQGTSVTTSLMGTTGYQGLAPASAFNETFEWSPNDKTTSQFSDSDWTNGYGVSGLPAGGISQTRTNGTTPAPTGTLSISTDASSPSYQVVAGGSTGVVLGVFDINTSGSDSITLQRIGLRLASGSAQDVNRIYLYSGTNLLGTANFSGGSQVATSTLQTSPLLNDTLGPQITIKADINNVGISQPAVSGDLVQINVAGVQGVDQVTGATVSTSGNVGTGSGVRIFKSYPTVTLVSLPTLSLAQGSNVLMRFSVTAGPSGPVGLAGILGTISWSGVQFSNINLRAYADLGFSQGLAGFGGTDLSSNTASSGSLHTFFVVASSASNPIEIPAGSTYYFQVSGTVSNISGNASVTTSVNGDSSYLPLFSLSNTNHAMFTWSPNDNSTSVYSTADWTNGYGVAVLPPTGMTQTLTGTGTVTPPILPNPTAAMQGNASLNLNGGNQYVPLPAIGDSQTFTISAWTWYNGGANCGVVFSDGDSTPGNDVVLGLDSSNAYIRADKSGSNLAAGACGTMGAVQVALGKNISQAWHHIVWVNNGSGQAIYVDGAMALGVPYSTGSNVGYHAASPSIGRMFDGSNGSYPRGANYFDGNIADFRYYNSAFSTAQVSQLYTAGMQYGNNTITPSVASSIGTGGGASAPTCTLTATPNSITSGQSMTISWTSQNAASATWIPDPSGKDNVPPTGTPSTSGSMSFTPPTILVGSYNPSEFLKVTGAGGSATCSVNLNVVGSEQAAFDNTVFGQTSPTPTISGTASGVSTVTIVLKGGSPTGATAYNVSAVQVVNGHWSVTVSPALAAGAYFIYVYDANNTVLTNGGYLNISNNATTTVPTKTIVFLTSGSSWTVPSGWNSNNNTVEVIGGGGGGGSTNQQGGGGGGAYSKISNLSLTVGASISYVVGSGGFSNTAGADSYFNGTGCTGSSVCAKGGSASGGAGGQASAGVGTTKYSGGNGGGNGNVGSDGGGGGAAGPNGDGWSGGASDQGGAGGGGGADAGTGSSGTSAGSVDCYSSSAGNGGTGPTGTVGGTGGGNGVNGSSGNNGAGGGGGGCYAGGGNGGSGTEWSTVGAGGGGGGAYSGSIGNGGNFGGGGGGNGNGTGGSGAPGVIVITYTPATASSADKNANLANALTALQSALQGLLAKLGQ